MVERTIGTKLAPADGAGPGGMTVFAKNVRLRDALIGLVDYREAPASDGKPARFLLLSLQVSADPCISRSSVGHEFGEVYGGPGPDAGKYSNIYFHELVDSVVVSFGFPLEGQDCVKLVIFNPDIQRHP